MRELGLRLPLLVLVLIGSSPLAALGQVTRGRPPARPSRIAHEIIRAGAVSRGVAATLTTMMHDDAVLVWPGLPVVTTKARVAAVLEAQHYPLGVTFEMQPLDLRVATDSSMVLYYGVAYWSLPDSSRGNLGRYLMAWHRRDDGWDLAAFALSEMVGFPPAEVPDSMVLRGSEAILTVGESNPRQFVATDLAFADSAGRATAAEAFRHWAAPDGVTFETGGILNRGPDEIAASLKGLDGTRWAWRPMAAGAASDGSLGWTAGEVSVSLPGQGGRPDRVIRSTYLTLWQRQPDGSLKFIADGGGDRP
jgi:ketosteroid isomerase-like protein